MPAELPGDDRPCSGRDRGRLRLAIVAVVALWVYGYNVLVKRQGPVRGFFEILDTISDDFVMGALLTVILGTGIAVVFSLTKLYSQVLSNTHSFRMLEVLVHDQLRRGRLWNFLLGLANFQSLPTPDTVYPHRVSSVLLALCGIYVTSCIYVVLFSEALFFVAWSAGVDLPVNSEDNVVLMPTLALAVPFSARVMAYVRYPYAQDYGDFMPGAVFVLLIVTALGYAFGSGTQAFYLARVYEQGDYVFAFVRNGIFLAFIPVFFEALFWLYELHRDDHRAAAGPGDPAAGGVPASGQDDAATAE